MDIPYIERVKKLNESYDGTEEVEDELDISAFGKRSLLRLYFDDRKGIRKDDKF